MDRPSLLAAAKQVLTTNDRGYWTTPTNSSLYPHQWLWDAFFIGIGRRWLDLERARDEVWSPFRAQWRNGMVPHTIFGAGKGYHAGPSLWRCEVSAYAPRYIQTSGVTQPPVAAEAVVRIGELMAPKERLAWYREMYPRIVRWHQWFYRERDLDGDGLVAVVLSWETGLDNSPPWLEIMRSKATPAHLKAAKLLGLGQALERRRRDTKAVPAAQRITTIDLHTVYDLIKHLRRLRYDYRAIAAKHPLRIADLTTNCILMRANERLAEIAAVIGESLPADIRKAMRQAPEALESLWDEAAGEYFCRDLVSGGLIKVSSIGTFMPLYAQVLPAQRRERLLEKLRDPALYGTPYPIPSTPLNSPYFNAHRYWQGPSWVNTNWLIIDGLLRNGYKPEAIRLREQTLAMVAKGGMHEYFSPLDASPAGADVFSWTAALTIDLLAQTGKLGH